jgi:DNA-binding FadR family transcriptional regulator
VTEPELLRRVARTSVPDALYAQLRDAIVTGAYRPGEALPTERELSAGSGANRLAVREAMQRLRQVGLVEIVHGGGSRVIDWRTTADLSVLPDVVGANDLALQEELTAALGRFRLVIAIDACSRLAARPLVDADRDRLRELATSADDADGDTAVQIGEEFWDALFEVLGSVAHRLVNNTIRATRLAAPRAPTQFTLRRGRVAIVDAIEAGDPDAATDAVQELFDAVL